MQIDDFAPNLSFFFSNGMDPEYAVIGRVARRIWARAMRDLYRAGPRSQMLKYHIQTSGRSLHAQEIQFNDVRTTLQALYAREGLVFTAFAAAVSIERPRIVWSLYAANPMVAGGWSFPAQSPVSRTEKDKRARGAWESLQRAAQRVDSPSH